MVSGFTSGALGFGLPLTAEELAKVNAYRQLPENSTYKCGQFGAPQALCALGKVTESDKKPVLLTSPGLRIIYNNKAADGYWNSAHMMVHAEDVDDVTKCLYPWCAVVHEYDHSGVHSAQKVDALNANKMSASFGGAQTRKRPSIITAGCLGPFPATRLVDGIVTNVKLNEGDTQYMVFKEENLPPWYAPNTPKEDTPTGVMVPKKCKKKERKTKTAQLMTGGQVQSPAEEVLVPGMTAGYVDKAKGFKDVLFERGLLNPANLGAYSIHGTKGAGGVVDESTSLLSLMAKCEDFKTETTAMHELMAVLGIGMEQSPKGHPELAGRGMEYCWGKSKYEHRKHNNFVSSKENFEKRVMAALGSVTLKRSRAFLRKANDYKRAYRMLIDGAGVGAVAQYADIEKMCALVKTHRCTFDQDYKFIADS